MLKQLKFNKKGLTLVETAGAVVILGIIIIAMVGAFAVARLSIVNAKHRIKAINLTKAQMEWVMAQEFDTVKGWIANPITENDVDNTVGGDELINDTRTTTVTLDANGNLIVTVTLNWEKRGMTGTLAKGTSNNPDERLVTLISP